MIQLQFNFFHTLIKMINSGFNIFILLHIIFIQMNTEKAESTGGLPLAVKDTGLVELKKEDVAMIFYVTVSNTGNQPLELAVNGTKCCRKVTEGDEDCDSMKLFGGDMGKLFPQDNRNLTLLYVNLYLHDRVGSCDVEIKDGSGNSMTQSVKFNTKLVKEGIIPRLLEQYYDAENVMTCDSVDKDPLNECQPYICDIRYDGTRSVYNHTTKRCEKIAKCVADPTRPEQLVAYNIQIGTCKNLINMMTPEDFAEFKEGKPSVHSLKKEHGYPINVRCHHGEVSLQSRWCECNEGWASAPFDHMYFNPDIQVYHMCTVWTGEMNAEQAKNITVMPKSQHKKAIIAVFIFFGISILLLLLLFAYLMYRLRASRRVAKADDALNESEMASLREHTEDSD